MIYFNRKTYPYMEEVNLGILRQFAKGNDEIEILDVGCGSGALGEALKNRGYCVWGIEFDKGAAEKASTRLNQSFQADLLDFELILKTLKDKKFDYIIFSDVLEHVFDPLTVIEFYQKFLKQSGQLVISVPNFLNWENRIRVFFGCFSYTDTGVLDRTHMRFFSYKTAKDLIQAAQFEVLSEDHTPYLIRFFLPLLKKLTQSKPQNKPQVQPEQIINSPLYQIYKKYFFQIEHFFCRLNRSLFAFQIILVGQKKAM